MMISTGLEPRVSKIRVQPKQEVTFSYRSATFPLPNHAEDAWMVELASREDTQLAPRGTVMQVLILSSSPKEQKRGAKVTISDSELLVEDAGRLPKLISRAKKDYGIPDDAVLVTTYSLEFMMTEYRFEWYELEV